MKHITYYIAAMAALLTGAPLHASDEAAATPVPAVQKAVRETLFVTGTPHDGCSALHLHFHGLMVWPVSLHHAPHCGALC